MRATLLFSAEDRLIGYILYIARDRQNDVRTRMESLYFGPDPPMGDGPVDRVAVAIRDRSNLDHLLPGHGRVSYREGKAVWRESRPSTR